MFNRLARLTKETQYRLNLRKTLANATIEQLHITLNETKKEIQRRNKNKR